MKHYAVFLEGSNFLLSDAQGTSKLYGFFATRSVRANSSEEASTAAVHLVWRDPKISGQEKVNPAPSIDVKVVHELLASNEAIDTGFILFEMESE